MFSKKIKTLFATLLAVSAISSLSAGEGLYLGGYGGINVVDYKANEVQDLDLKNDYTAGITVGHRWTSGWRFETDIGYHRNGFEETSASSAGKVQTVSAMENVIYEIPLDSQLRPHIGAGIGYSETWTKADDKSIDTHSRSFAYQGIAGVSYPLNECLSMAADYRYYRDNKETANHSVTLGVQQYF